MHIGMSLLHMQCQHRCNMPCWQQLRTCTCLQICAAKPNHPMHKTAQGSRWLTTSLCAYPHSPEHHLVGTS
jgi:hypothetical protein